MWSWLTLIPQDSRWSFYTCLQTVPEDQHLETTSENIITEHSSTANHSTAGNMGSVINNDMNCETQTEISLFLREVRTSPIVFVESDSRLIYGTIGGIGVKSACNVKFWCMHVSDLVCNFSTIFQRCHNVVYCALFIATIETEHTTSHSERVM